jgi:polyphosphate kinase 2 (PPK2 family)
VDVERHLVRNGTAIRKFFLHVSPEEQRQRFLARLDDPEKLWKFNARDVRERSRWGEYMRAYEEAIRATSTRGAPWYVIPADRKWFARLAVVELVRGALEGLDLAYPRPDSTEEIEEARALLLADDPAPEKPSRRRRARR